MIPVEELDAMVARATAAREAGRFADALADLRRATELRPDSAKAMQHMGALLGQLGRLDEAEAALRRTLTLAPGDAPTRYSLAGVLMALGRYPEAWALYDARFEVPELGIVPPPLAFPRWRSWHPAGRRVLVFPEQGLGDQIQFARFVPGLVAEGAAVTLIASPPLVRLFAANLPGVQVIAAAGKVDFPDPDFWVMSSDLPGLAGATPATLPQPPYIAVPDPPPRAPGDGFRVGLMTRGNPRLAQDARRSLAPEAAERLRRALPGRVVPLAPEESGAGDMADTARIMATLDLVVSVDTATAHLAGALGVRCATLIRGFARDWRWPPPGERSAWYPEMALYHGAEDGRWDEAIQALAADARALAGG